MPISFPLASAVPAAVVLIVAVVLGRGAGNEVFFEDVSSRTGGSFLLKNAEAAEEPMLRNGQPVAVKHALERVAA